jgi:molybdate transport system regulatory protein
MAKTNKQRATAHESPRLRVLLGAAIAIGPGKADLLDAIAANGSISAAAKRMGMSYRRAWLLVDTMNGCFQGPLVASVRGGVGGGGARLTPLGVEVLARYRDMEAKALQCLDDDLSAFAKLMR